MTIPRRVALLLISAQLVATSRALAQPANPAGAGNTAGRTAPVDDDEDEDPIIRPRTNVAPPPTTTASTNTTTTAAPNKNANNDWVADETEEQAEARRERMLPRFSSLDGSLGLLHISSAEPASGQTFRFGLIAEYWGADRFLRPVNNTDHPLTDATLPETPNHIGGTLTLSYTPLRIMGKLPISLEVFGQLRSYANFNNTGSPKLFQTLGDSQLGVKGVFGLFKGFNLGVSAAVVLLNTAGNIGVQGASTSANFRLAAMFDLQQYTPAPVRFHFNVGYYLDNSAELSRGVERARQMAAPGYDPTVCNRPPTTDRSDPRNNNPACHVEISRVERFALGINRADRVNIGIGVDANILGYVRPFVEWNVGVPVNRQGYICYLPSNGVPGDDDKCLQQPTAPGASTFRDMFASFPSTLTIGTRLTAPQVRGLALTAAFDIGTSGQNLFVRELAPTTPWMFYFGASYAHDFAPQVKRIVEQREVVRNVEVVKDPPHGTVVGTIIDNDTKAPIGNALVDFTGHPELGVVATGPDGIFRARYVPPGTYEAHAAVGDYNDNRCQVTVPAPAANAENHDVGEVKLECALTALPRAGSITGKVTNIANNQPIAGITVRLTPASTFATRPGQTAPTPLTAVTGADGSFTIPNALAGDWVVQAELGPTTRASTPRPVAIHARESVNGDMQVAAVDNRIRFTGNTLTLNNIHFANDSSELQPDSDQLLEKLADLLNRHPEFTSIEIQGHTDNRGTRDHNMQLSQARADSVRTRLLSLGVAADRLTARGYGPDQPLVPNITDGNRARNRRVVFKILTRNAALATGTTAPPTR